MRNLVFGIAFAFLLFGNAAQIVAQTKIEKEEALSVVEEMPEFPGGQDAMNKFIGNKVVYPIAAIEKNIVGKVYVLFIVETDGTLTEFEVVRGASPELDSAALNAIRQMPKWSPGKQSGKAVRVKCVIPVDFMLEKKRKRYIH